MGEAQCLELLSAWGSAQTRPWDQGGVPLGPSRLFRFLPAPYTPAFYPNAIRGHLGPAVSTPLSPGPSLTGVTR